MVTAETQLDGGNSVQQMLSLLGALLVGIGGLCVAFPDVAWCQDADPESAPAAAESPAGDAEGADAAEPRDSYERLEVNETLKNKAAINPILLASKFNNPPDRPAFDQYYKEYAFPRWTYPQNFVGVNAKTNVHANLRGDLRVAKGEVHDHLVQMTFEFMNSLATGPYHPAAQINAILMIGELNSVESVGNEPPKPYPDTLPVLLAAMENDKASDALRAAAMVGVVRHVESKIDNADVRKSVTTAMLKQAAVEVASGPEGTGRNWIRGQTVHALGLLGAVGENNEVFNAILKSVGDNGLSFSTRCLAADALGRLDYNGVEGIDIGAATAILGPFIVETCGDEIHLAKESERKVFRRRMKECLNVVTIALSGDGNAAHKGIASLAKEEQATRLTELLKLMKTMVDANLDDKSLEEDKLRKAAESFRGSVQEWLKAQS